jgi:hypothetical protein
MGIRVLVLAVLLLVPNAVFGENPPPPPAPGSVDERSPVVALGLSAGITAAGFAMFFSESPGTIGAGVVLFAVGPTTGHWYGGRFGNGGTIARLTGIGVMALGVSQADISLTGDGDDGNALAIMLAGAIIYTAGGVYEIYTAPRTVHEYNARQRIAVTPVISPRFTGVALARGF